MNINIRQLKEAIAQLPGAEKAGDIYMLNIISRVDALNRGVNAGECTKESCSKQIVKCVAVKYCYSEHNCWLEWELAV